MEHQVAASTTQWNLVPPVPPRRLPQHSLAAQASTDQDDSGSDTWRDIEEEIVSLQVRQITKMVKLYMQLSSCGKVINTFEGKLITH